MRASNYHIWAMEPARHRRYQVTVNNVTENTNNVLTALESNDGIEYIAWCTESAPTTGHTHMHIYIRFRNDTAVATVKELFPGAHVEVCHGSENANIVYLQKQGDFHEHGTAHLERGESEKRKWKDILEHCEANDLDYIKSEYPQVYVTRLRDLERIRNKKVVKESIDRLQNMWIKGKTGRGKSRSVRTRFPGLYQKNWNKWWDNYEYEDTVLLEDADPDVCEHIAYYLKIWADHHPFNAEVKGGMFKAIRPKRIIVTSQYSIEDCFHRPEDREALLRRFEVIDM